MKKRRLPIVIAVVFVVFSIVGLMPIITYYTHLYSLPVGSNTDIYAVWGTYGDYLSGTTGVVLSFFATTLSLISIYYTIKTTNDISLRELEITTIQNKPIPYIDLTKYDNVTKVEIFNMGPGALTVTEIKIEKCDVNGVVVASYQNFDKLFRDRLNNIQIPKDSIEILFYTAPNFILSNDKSKNLIEVIPKTGTIDNDFIKINNIVKEVICEYKIVINYKDIFENVYPSYEKSLIFFKAN